MGLEKPSVQVKKIAAPQKKEKPEILKGAKQKLQQMKAVLSPKNYLDKSGKVDIKKVKQNAAQMSPGLLAKIDNLSSKQHVIREVLFDGDSFRPKNKAQEKYIGLADVYRDQPEVRSMLVDGKLAVRKGLSGSFYYVETDEKGKPTKPIRKTGYAAILDGTTAKPVEMIKPAELKKLKSSFEIKDKVTIDLVRKSVKSKISQMYKIDEKSGSKMILEAAANEGIDAKALTEILEKRQFPKGFLTITGHEPFNVLVRWAARLTAINEEKFTAQAKDKPRKGRTFTKAFRIFNQTGQYSKDVKLKSDHKRLWRRQYTGRVNLSNSVLLEKLTPAQIARIRAKEKHLPPEKIRQIKKRLFELERKHLSEGGKPGFIDGVKRMDSEYIRLLEQLKTPDTETIEGSETFKRRLELMKKACRLYKLPSRFVPIMLGILRHESNYGRVMINTSNPRSGAAGIGQFIWSTWKKFLRSMQTSEHKDYYVKARKDGHLPMRGDDFFMIHAMAWHLRRSVNYLKKTGMSEDQALNLPAKWYYVHYHDGDAGAVALRKYLKTRDVRDLRHSFQTNYNGRFDPAGRTAWMMRYSDKVQRTTNRWEKYGRG